LVAAAEPHRSFLSEKLQGLRTSVSARELQVQP